MSYKPTLIILQVLPSLNSGGVERGTIEIAEALTQSYITSYVASNGGRLVSKLEDLKVKHFTIPLNSKNPFTIIRNIFALVKIIKENNINIIHARSRAPAWSAYFAAKITKINFLASFHGVYSYDNCFKKYYNSIMTKSEKIIAVSNFIKDHIETNYNKHNITVIHRGVDANYFNPEKIDQSAITQLKSELNLSNAKIILVPGRITRWKGHLYLIEALKKVQSSFKCLIVGDSKDSNYIKEINEKLNEYNLQEYVTILPNQLNMSITYMLADLVVSPSIRAEAFGRVIIEAQAMERLVIATNLGGATETIIDSKSGWLAPYNNSDEFANIIDKVLNLDEVEQNDIKSNARDHITNNFSLDNMTSKTLELYKSFF